MNILEYSSGQHHHLSYFKKIQDVGIPWIFKNIQTYKSLISRNSRLMKFLEIPGSFFLQADTGFQKAGGSVKALSLKMALSLENLNFET